ncbi:MAG: hypothetical protein R2712_27675 [Vicinamibacterales bacterium]
MQDRSRLQPIIGLKPGQMAAVSGEVLHCHVQQARRANFRLFTALVQDASADRWSGPTRRSSRT